ncbi:CpsB/CapC family capsule biosynthesis tyrosine phosphatase, partial [Levilactobacillus brevis]
IFELQARGITPVIAHPERNHGFQKEPDRLYDFVEMGCLTQLTSSSYLGVFGDNVEKLTAKIIRSGMGFAFSSDAHNFKGRRFLMGDAFNKLEQQAGKDVAIRFNDDARAILNGEEIVKPEFTRISVLKKKKRFWLF